MAWTAYINDIQKTFIAYYQRPAAPAGLEYWAGKLDEANGDAQSIINSFAASAEATDLYGEINSDTIEDVVISMYQGLFGRAPKTEGLNYYVDAFNSGDLTTGQIALTILNAASGDDATIINNKVQAANYFTNAVSANEVTYSGDDDAVNGRMYLSQVNATYTHTQTDATNFVMQYIDNEGTTFNLATEELMGRDGSDLQAMRLTGDQDVRIDFTNPDNQIKGLDLDGDGVIEYDGQENNQSGIASDFEIVDAYSRNPLNHNDIVNNFLGDIAFDGTGFEGDGVNTDGNIFLGGLGQDTALGGIGNDFMAGGGAILDGGQINNMNALTQVASELAGDQLYGGRNADFFFTELSRLDFTDGDSLYIHGGSTSDDAAVGNNTPQDSDWVLIEASDDDEPVTIDLSGAGVAANFPLVEDPNGFVGEQDQWILTDSGDTVFMEEIENVDASGNLYGFMDQVDVTLGGRQDAFDPDSGAENVGIGSSAQLDIHGSAANNILIGGFDNDQIDGETGNDLLMGGRLDYLNNPNMTSIINDGMDELTGGAGTDDIVFEMDGGVYEGGATQDVDDGTMDTLWLTENTYGTQAADDLTTDGTVRIDLGAGMNGGYNNYAGYGGADQGGTAAGYTADQTNYETGYNFAQVQDFTNVIATGLGAVDYLPAGTNNPELSFNYQQNLYAIDGDLDLRGTDAANIIYATDGDDVIEGRMGDDMLSGGAGNDDFIFYLQDNTGDGVDVIHRQQDLVDNTTGEDGADNLWDVDASGNALYMQDFNKEGINTVQSDSTLTLVLRDNARPEDELENFALQNVMFTDDGESYTLSIALEEGSATYQSLTDTIAAQLDDTRFDVSLNPDTVTIDDPVLGMIDVSNTITITDSQGGNIEFLGWDMAQDQQDPSFSYLGTGYVGAPIVEESFDRLIYKAYEDRADNEGVDDDAYTGSSISLGRDAYAEDLVVSFEPEDWDMDGDGKVDTDSAGTRLAEDQQYTVKFTNLTTEDVVTIKVNGVEYQLQVGIDLDLNTLDNEDDNGNGETDQDTIQANFLERMTNFINSFMDADTAAGRVDAAFDGVDTIILSQHAYKGEETVFMRYPVVTVSNDSGGEKADYTVTNTSQHEVQLLDFDGRNAGLNADNVLFIGEEDISRSVLQTAATEGGTMVGMDAMIIDGGTSDATGKDDLQDTMADGDLLAGSLNEDGEMEIPNNTATNAELGGNDQNFSIHGDDLLIGGDGADVIYGGTGDDRVIGSMGTDTIDGGKDYYVVDVLGESQDRVYVLNDWEAANTSQVTDLSTLTISSISLMNQTETGDGFVSGRFDDTLLFQQEDFEAGVTQFTITLDDFTVNNNVVELPDGGAGTVSVDVDANGTADATTDFTNFENIRTVSGQGRAVANDGQGNDGEQGRDTLVVSSLSTSTGGIMMYMTGDEATAGFVRYSIDDHANVDATESVPVGAFTENYPLTDIVDEFETELIKVDGVENVIAGSGSDLLVIDETEAAKDNVFTGGNGVDRIEYQNNYDTVAVPEDAEPTVTIAVSATGEATVQMTSGRVGATVATDTLSSVEWITLNENTAQGTLENDMIDDSGITGGSIVDYVDQTISTAGDSLLEHVENMYEMELVQGGSGEDTVIPATAGVMSMNARSDTVADQADMEIDTYLNYDYINENDLTDRLLLAEIASGTDDVVLGDLTVMPQSLNFDQFQYDLGTNNNDPKHENDTVDYSLETSQIVSVVDFRADADVQYIMVNGNAEDDNFGDDASDRVDRLTGVENIVASQGDSVLDLTQASTNLKITFSNNYDPNSETDYSTAGFDGYGREVHQIKVADATTGVSKVEMNYLDYVYVDSDTKSNDIIPNDARWNSIEGSDFNETIEVSGYEADSENTFNLRGGDNKVIYEGDKVVIDINVTEFDATDPANTGLITVEATHSAPKDMHDDDPSDDPIVSADDHISSYSAQNEIAAGSLTIKGARSNDDTIMFNTALQNTEKYFILGGVVDATSAITVQVDSGSDANSLSLVGFEILQDADSNDSYDLLNLANVTDNLVLEDNAVDDHDAIRLSGSDGVDSNLIDLDTFMEDPNVAGASEFALNMEFDVLDVVDVTSANLTLDGTTGAGYKDASTTDEVVLGSLSGINTITNFESVVMTEESLGGGNSFTLDISAGTLTRGEDSKIINFDGNVLSFGGLVLEGELWNSYLEQSDDITDGIATTGVTVTVEDLAAVGTTVVGGEGNDNILGSAGDDILIGRAGDDTLDGGIATEIRSFELGGQLAADGNFASFNFLGLGNLTLSEAAVATEVGQDWTVVDGAGPIVVSEAMADLLNANLEQVNDDWQTMYNAPDEVITGVSYSGGKLLFNFQSGIDVVNPIDLGYAANGDSSATPFTVSSETTEADGGAGGTNTLYGGLGIDTISGGAADDAIVVLGTIAADEYVAADVTGTTAAALNLTDTITQAKTTTDMTTDSYDGGLGYDTMELWGTVDMTNASFNSIDLLDIHSSVTLSASQFEEDFAGVDIILEGEDSELYISGTADPVLIGTSSIADLQSFAAEYGTGSITNLNGSAADTTAPTLSATSPLDDATDVAVDSNIVLTFNENVQAGTGDFEIFAAGGSLVETVSAASASFSGDQVTINPTADLADGSSFYVTVDSDAVLDMSDNAFAGISDSTTFNFTTAAAAGDVTPPTLALTSPADDATGVDGASNIVLTFDENVQAGAGNFEIHDASDDSLVEAIAASAATISGAMVTLDPTADLAAGSSFYVTVDGNAIQDMSGNAYAGISDTTSFNFDTTAAAGGVSIDMAAGGTYTGVDGQVDIFQYDIDSSSGRAVQKDGEVTVDNFNTAEDILQFIDLGAGTITTANFTTFPGVSSTESPFKKNTTIFFDPDNGASGIVTMQGIQDAGLTTIGYEVV